MIAHTLKANSTDDELKEISAFLGIPVWDLFDVHLLDYHGKRIGRVQNVTLETAEATVILSTPQKPPTIGEVLCNSNGPIEVTFDVTGCRLSFDKHPDRLFILPYRGAAS